MRRLLLLFLFCLPAFCQPTCTAQTTGGVTNLCNVSYDSTIPSGQTYSRTMCCIFYPQGGAANASNDIAVVLPGRGWSGTTESYYTVGFGAITNLAISLVTTYGWAVYTPYTTWPAAQWVTASHSIGDTSLTVSNPYGNASQNWWPNIGGCVDGCAGITTPFSAIYGNAAAGDQETVTVSAQSGGGKTMTVGALTKNHAANEWIYLPKTQFPSSVADMTSAFNWIGTNAGQGTYPGNPMRIHVFTVSSDAHLSLMTILNAHNLCLVSCPAGFQSWWGTSVGNNGGSLNSASNWNVIDAFVVGVPWDLNYMQANTSSGSGTNYTQVGPALLGCVQGVDAGCNAFATTWSPTTYLSTSSFHGSIFSLTGVNDFTMPVCPYAESWTTYKPCAGNQYAATGLPFYVVLSGLGAGHASDCTFTPIAGGSCWFVATTQLVGGNAASGTASGASF